MHNALFTVLRPQVTRRFYIIILQMILYFLYELLKIKYLGQVFPWPLALLPREKCPWCVPLNEKLESGFISGKVTLKNKKGKVT